MRGRKMPLASFNLYQFFLNLLFFDFRQHDFNYRLTDADILIRYMKKYPNLCPKSLSNG